MEKAQILIKATDQTANAFSSVQRNFSAVHSTLSQLAPALTAAFSVGGIVAFATSALNAGDELAKLSQKTGLSVESLSKWRFVAESSGTTLEGMLPGLRSLAQNMDTAANGGKESAEVFRRLGVPVKDARGNLRGMDAVMLDLADRFSKMPDGAQKSALAVRVFGKAGLELIPVMNQGRAGIGELMGTAEKLGLVMTGEAARAAEQFKDSLDLIKSAAGGLKTEFLINTAPAFSHVAKEMADAVKQGGALAGVFRGLTASAELLLIDTRNAGGRIIELEDKLKTMKRLRDELSKPTAANKLNDLIFGDVKDLNIQIAVVEKELDVLRKLQTARAESAIAKDAPKGRIEDPTEAERRRKREEAAKKHAEALVKYQEITWAQMVETEERGAKELADLRSGGLLDKLFGQQDLPEPPKNVMGVSSELFEMYRERARVASETLGVEVQKHKELEAAQQQSLERLRTSLMTDSELLKASYDEDLNTLNNTLGMKQDAQEEYYKLLGRLYRKNANDQMMIEMQKNQALRGMQISTWQLGVGLLQSLSGESKAAAYAVIAINTGLSMSQAIQATAVATMRAFSDLGPVAGSAAAAKIALLGKVQLGLIAAAGALQAANVGKGAAVGTFSANPSTGLPESPLSSGFQAPLAPAPAQAVPVQPKRVGITVQGNALYDAETIRTLIRQINEQLDDNVRLEVN